MLLSPITGHILPTMTVGWIQRSSTRGACFRSVAWRCYRPVHHRIGQAINDWPLLAKHKTCLAATIQPFGETPPLDMHRILSCFSSGRFLLSLIPKVPEPKPEQKCKCNCVFSSSASERPTGLADRPLEITNKILIVETSATCRTNPVMRQSKRHSVVGSARVAVGQSR